MTFRTTKSDRSRPDKLGMWAPLAGPGCSRVAAVTNKHIHVHLSALKDGLIKLLAHDHKCEIIQQCGLPVSIGNGFPPIFRGLLVECGTGSFAENKLTYFSFQVYISKYEMLFPHYHYMPSFSLPRKYDISLNS